MHTILTLLIPIIWQNYITYTPVVQTANASNIMVVGLNPRECMNWYNFYIEGSHIKYKHLPNALM